jgi:DNA-binding NarL/FixJ family response regulator
VPILTGRQIEVLRGLARGQTNAEIADELFVARRTVDNHVSAILSRLGVEGRSRAVEEAVARGMIEA